MQNGGARPGAGRKPKRKVAVKKVMAEAILSSVNELEMWTDLLTAVSVTSVALVGGEEATFEKVTVPDYNIRFKALAYLTDRRDGKAPQTVAHTGDGLKVYVEHIGRPSDRPEYSASA